MRIHRILFAIALFLLALPLWAQDPRGKIMGRVSDASGGVMPGVEVRATNAATGTSVSGTTNAAGNYSMPFIPATIYTVTAEMGGSRNTSARASRSGLARRLSSTSRWKSEASADLVRDGPKRRFSTRRARRWDSGRRAADPRAADIFRQSLRADPAGAGGHQRHRLAHKKGRLQQRAVADIE